MLESLIDNGSKMCGSDSAMARFLGVHPSLITRIRAKERHLSPEQAVKLAALLDEDVTLALLEAHKAQKIPLIRTRSAGRRAGES